MTLPTFQKTVRPLGACLSGERPLRLALENGPLQLVVKRTATDTLRQRIITSNGLMSKITKSNTIRLAARSAVRTLEMRDKSQIIVSFSPCDNQAALTADNSRPDVGVEHRELSPIIGLKKFNNWIKSVLIGKFAFRGQNRPGANVLDLGCGKGGDLNKWKQARIRLYVGMG